jgi:hypothetical protein
MIKGVCAARPDVQNDLEVVYARRHAMWCLRAAQAHGVPAGDALHACSEPFGLQPFVFPSWCGIRAAAHGLDGPSRNIGT